MSSAPRAESAGLSPHTPVGRNSEQSAMTLGGASKGRPAGTIQVDVDGLWVWQQLLGEPMRLEQDELFDVAITRLLDLFRQYDIRATFFVNGLDLEVPSKRAVIQRVAGEGHEIASHGQTHAYLTGMPSAGQAVEVHRSAALIERAIGHPPSGFRSPGFSVDAVTLDLLEQAGYRYDSSVFSASLAGWVRMAYRLISGGKQMARHRLAFSFRTPIAPYRPHAGDPYCAGDRPILEVPVTVVPCMRLPFHFSYTVLGGAGYFEWGLRQLVARRVPINYVFHLVDVVQPSYEPLRRVIGVNIPVTRKLSLIRRVLEALHASYRLTTTDELVCELAGEPEPVGIPDAVAAA